MSCCWDFQLRYTISSGNTEKKNVFVTPTKGTFNCVVAGNSECVFLNDFCRSEKVIPWSDALNFLEEELIQVLTSQTHYPESPMCTKDTPIFAKSEIKILKYECGQVNEVETKIMDRQWRFLYFKFDVNTKIDLQPCPTRSHLVLNSNPRVK